MNNPFFIAGRENLFRPLAGKRRAKVLACISALYDRVFGPGADYFSRVNQEALKSLFAATLAGNPDLKNLSGADDDQDAGETYDIPREAALIIRQELVRQGMLPKPESELPLEFPIGASS